LGFHRIRSAPRARRICPGRLGGLRQPDAEPRPAIRPVDRPVCELGRVSAVPSRTAAAGYEQLRAARRLCLQPERPDGPSRRWRQVLRRSHEPAEFHAAHGAVPEPAGAV
jgi:hypothetical protein